MSASNLVEAGNRILEAQGKKARQSLQRKPSGQIYRVPIIRMVKVLQKIFKGMDWHIITYNKMTGQGTYILKLKPNTRTPYHKHNDYEEFYILDGELIDKDNLKFKKGDFISFKPGTRHSSYTKKGCTLLVFMRKKNKLL